MSKTSQAGKTIERPPEPTPIGEGLKERLMRTEPERFVPSGLARLDNIILGAMPYELTIIAGDPSQGKTSLAVQWGVVTAQEFGPAAMLSLEMKKPALQDRMVGGLTGIPTRTLRTREWASAKQKKQALEAEEYLSTLPFLVDDRSYMSPEQVYATIVSWRDLGVVLGIVDYIQLIRSGNDSRAVQVSEAVQACKAGARDSGIPILGISSVNRASSSREDKKPKMSDLKESGDLEFTVDTLLMFSYPNAPDDHFDDIRAADIYVMKQRNGPTGVASVQFNKPATRFEPLEERKNEST